MKTALIIVISILLAAAGLGLYFYLVIHSADIGGMTLPDKITLAVIVALAVIWVFVVIFVIKPKNNG